MPTVSAPPQARHRRANATRARILDAARRELDGNPDSSLCDIAEAAGVARRTIYTHFTGRAALLVGLVEDAADAVRLAIADSGEPDVSTDPPAALTAFVLTLWPVGGCYRMLIGLADRELSPDRVRAALAPARRRVACILAEGQRQGVFHTAVPPGPLSGAIEAHLLALLSAVTYGIWADDGTAAAVAALIAAGVDDSTARDTVRRAQGTKAFRPAPGSEHATHVRVAAE